MQTTTNGRWRGWGPAPRPAADRKLTYDRDRNRLRITEGGVTMTFALDDISQDGTRAIRLVVLDDDLSGEVTVILAGRGSECDCPASIKWGHKTPCVHISALLALQRAGRLA